MHTWRFAPKVPFFAATPHEEKETQWYKNQPKKRQKQKKKSAKIIRKSIEKPPCKTRHKSIQNTTKVNTKHNEIKPNSIWMEDEKSKSIVETIYKLGKKCSDKLPL